MCSIQVFTKHLFIVSDRGVKQSSPGRKEDKTDGQVKSDTTILGNFCYSCLSMDAPTSQGRKLYRLSEGRLILIGTSTGFGVMG